jgi:hypothetical protein
MQSPFADALLGEDLGDFLAIEMGRKIQYNQWISRCKG